MKIVDIGCGLNPDVRATFFLDQILQHKNNFVQGDAQSLPFKTNSFDLVISKYVIEHCLSPVKYIKELMRISKKNIEIWTDNGACIGFHFGELLGIKRPDHLYLWSGISLANLLTILNCDFSLEYTNNNKINMRGIKKLRWLAELRFLSWLPCRLFKRDLKVIIRRNECELL